MVSYRPEVEKVIIPTGHFCQQLFLTGDALLRAALLEESSCTDIKEALDGIAKNDMVLANGHLHFSETGWGQREPILRLTH